jgi:hypothetical protein
VSPVIITGELEAEAVTPPGEDVAVYVVTMPFVFSVVNDTLTLFVPGTILAATFVGLLGTGRVVDVKRYVNGTGVVITVKYTNDGVK